MKRSAILTVLLLTFPVALSVALVGPASANSCGSTLAHDPATFTPAHESTVGPTPLIRVKFLDALPHCGIGSVSMTLDNLDSSDAPYSVGATGRPEGDHYVVEHQVASSLASQRWQVVARVTESGSGSLSATVAWNFYVSQGGGCGTSLAHDPATFTPAHDSISSATPSIRVEFIDYGAQCGIASASLTLDNLDTTTDTPRALTTTTSALPSRYVLQHQITTALAPAYYQVVARMTEAESGVSATVAWNFRVPQNTACGTSTTHDPSSFAPAHEGETTSSVPTISVRFNDNGEQCGFQAFSMVLDDLNSNVNPPPLNIQASTVPGGYVLRGTPAQPLAQGYYQVVASVTERTSGTSNTVAWNFRLCFDADNDGLSDCNEAVYGTFPNDADSDDDGLNDGTELQRWSTYGTDAWRTDYDRLRPITNNLLTADADGDGLKDGVEFDAPTSIFGTCGNIGGANECPSPIVRDLYVQVNWMDLVCAAPCQSHSHRPTNAEITSFRQNFAIYNSNHNEIDRVRLHLYLGRNGDGVGGDSHHANTIEFGDLDGAWNDYYDYKDANFPPARSGIFFFTFFAHYVEGPRVGGVAYSLDDDNAVSHQNMGSATELVATWMQELGHNLIGDRHMLCRDVAGHDHGTFFNDQVAHFSFNEYAADEDPPASEDEGNNASGACTGPDGQQDVFYHSTQAGDAMGYGYTNWDATTYSADSWFDVRPGLALSNVQGGNDIERASFDHGHHHSHGPGEHAAHHHHPVPVARRTPVHPLTEMMQTLSNVLQ